MGQFVNNGVVLDRLSFNLKQEVEGQEGAVRHQQVIFHLEVRHSAGCGLDLSRTSRSQEGQKLLVSLGHGILEFLQETLQLWGVTLNNFLHELGAHHVQLSSFLALFDAGTLIVRIKQLVAELTFFGI